MSTADGAAQPIPAAEFERAQSEAALRAFLDAFPHAALLLAADGTVVMASAKAAARFGVPVERLSGTSLYAYLTGSVADDHRRRMKEAIETGVSVHSADSREGRYFLNHFVPVRDTERTVRWVAVVTEDVTDRKHGEESLAKSESRFRDLAENTTDFLWETDTARRFTYVNQSGAVLMGYTPEQLLGRSGTDFMRPADVAMLEERLRGAGDRREPFRHIESVVLHRDGRPMLFETSGVPIHDADGKYLGYRGISRDVTQHRRHDRDRHEFELRIRDTQKLESLGILAGGIAHEFNNLLTSILGHADLARSSMSPVSPSREDLECIVTAARKAADLTNQMLAFSGRGQFVLGPVHLPELVREMAHLIDVSVARRVTVTYQLDDCAPPIEGDAAQVRQIVMSLVSNGCEAIGDGIGTLTIRVSAGWWDRTFLAQDLHDQELPDGFYTVLEVTDTGCGMSDEVRQRIFEPFFTTKFTGRGLGLAAVLGIVRGHRGAITVTSTPGHGSTFRVAFPAAKGTPHQPRLSLADDELRGPATVLVVDDNESVCKLARRALEHAGYRVLIAGDGPAAIDLVRGGAHNIRVVILDLLMPKMSGEQVFRELRASNPDLRIVLSSGYGAQQATSRFKGLAFDGFVQKPYHVSQLVAVVRTALERGAAGA